jgi:hypothetical protein
MGTGVSENIQYDALVLVAFLCLVVCSNHTHPAIIHHDRSTRSCLRSHTCKQETYGVFGLSSFRALRRFEAVGRLSERPIDVQCSDPHLCSIRRYAVQDSAVVPCSSLVFVIPILVNLAAHVGRVGSEARRWGRGEEVSNG